MSNTINLGVDKTLEVFVKKQKSKASKEILKEKKRNFDGESL